MDNALYISNKYNKLNPNYHIEDSEFKAKNLLTILNKNFFDFKKINNVIDVGCGAGEVLKFIKKSKLFNSKTKFIGFDVNKKIIHFANKNCDNNIKFYCKSFFKTKSILKSSLIICTDVYEHIEDYINFLKKLLKYGNFFLFNIPLDISVRSLLSKKIIEDNFKKVGHIHFFNKHVAQLILNYCGYKIIDKFYAKNFLDHQTKNVKQKIYSIPIRLFDYINEDLTATFFGGYSLVVFAKK